MGSGDWTHSVNLKKKEDLKIKELEEELKLAEARCGTLKQQLDYIKLVYIGKIQVRGKFDKNLAKYSTSTEDNSLKAVKDQREKSLRQKRKTRNTNKLTKKEPKVIRSEIYCKPNSLVEIYKNNNMSDRSVNNSKQEVNQVSKTKSADEVVILIENKPRDKKSSRDTRPEQKLCKTDENEIQDDNVKFVEMKTGRDCDQKKEIGGSKENDKELMKTNHYNIFNDLKIKTLPFVAAKSTAPSHNIGINIQQVMSMIKVRPKSGLDLQKLKLREVAVKKQKSKSNLTHQPKHGGSHDWENDFKHRLHHLKRVLVYLHEDFNNLSETYRTLKKDFKENPKYSELEIRQELKSVTRKIRRKEEEIRVVIGLYRDVIKLRKEVYIFREARENKSSGVAADSEFVQSGVHTKHLRQIQNLKYMLDGTAV